MASGRPAAVAPGAVAGGPAGTRAAARDAPYELMSAGAYELDRMWAGAAQHVTRGRRIFARVPFEEAVLFTKTG